jgi:hypothetical protein
MSSLQHAVGFLQNAYTIVLALALSEAFKEFVAGDKDIFWNRFWALVGVLLLVFPFFHGMSRYLYTTYLAPGTAPPNFAPFLMTDGIAFMLMSACFFVMSRSLSPDRWQRYYAALAFLLIVDSNWIAFAMWRGAPVKTWLILNVVLGAILAGTYLYFRKTKETVWPPAICALTICATTIASYVLMRDFYFS